jgi:hypothetical protein
MKLDTLLEVSYEKTGGERGSILTLSYLETLVGGRYFFDECLGLLLQLRGVDCQKKKILKVPIGHGYCRREFETLWSIFQTTNVDRLICLVGNSSPGTNHVSQTTVSLSLS